MTGSDIFIELNQNSEQCVKFPCTIFIHNLCKFARLRPTSFIKKINLISNGQILNKKYKKYFVEHNVEHFLIAIILP